ncbi:methyltransferase [Streptomyces sp. 4F14]|uniref:methyltransferase n=1 Tax=Streptomyces sp. 4F14 TaxID=3394380 RepID=UPI003A8BE2E1
MTPDDITKISGLAHSFTVSKLLLSAVEIDLFTTLANTVEGSAETEELRAATGLHARAATDFFDALVALGLLEKTEGRYRNSPLAQGHLVRGENFRGGFLDGAGHALYPAWGRLTEALRTGKPQAEGDFEAMLDDPRARRTFLAMQDALSAPLVPQLLAAVDLGEFSTLVDVGGARGNLAGLLLQAAPGLTARVFDRPQNAGPCAEHAKTLGVEGRLDFTGGDFFADPLPAADVVVIGHVLADFSVDERKVLVRKAYEAVSPGGALLVYDPMPGDEPHLPALVSSLHMLVMTPAGAGYHPGDCEQWLRGAGFTDVSRHPLLLGNTLLVARKPG